MIESKADYRHYLEADRIAKARPLKQSILRRIKDVLLPDYIWEFQKTLRKLEYHKNCNKGLLATVRRLFITRKFRRLSQMLGFSIPPNVFGPGLSIAHMGTIVVNGTATVGANCRLHACVNIGTEAGYSGNTPSIGDNCYIAPGAKMYGDIVIADGIAIGANAVVNKSFDEGGIAIAGVPAKKIADVDTLDFLIPATRIIELGLNHTNDWSGVSARDVKSIMQRIAEEKTLDGS